MPQQQAESWKLSIFCDPADREKQEAQIEDVLAPFAMASFETQPDGTIWQIEAWFLDEPDRALCSGLFSAQGWAIEPVMPQNWVTKSLRPLDAVSAGRFFVYGSHDDGIDIPSDKIPLIIDAGLAFGTGHHGTTAGCLEAISIVAKNTKPRRVLDLGCGTGVLGLGAARLWPASQVILSDIDPDATAFTKRAAFENQFAQDGRLSIVTAPDLRHPQLTKAEPFDLIIANILAAPLVRLAPSISNALSRTSQSRLVLSGLLNNQEQMILSTYREHGLSIQHRIRKGEWSALVLGFSKATYVR